MDAAQRTLVLIKPDAVARGLVGEVLGRYEAKGLVIEALELRRIDASFADAHYAEHVDKAWYPPLRDFITSGPLVALILSGDSAIDAVRTLNGVTDGRAAAPGSAASARAARRRAPSNPGTRVDRPLAGPAREPTPRR